MFINKFNLQADGVFIIAELSANHGGSIDNALATIKAAKESGANAIKLQTYTPDTMTLNCNKSNFIIRGGTPWDGEKLYDLYAKAYTPWEWHQALFEYARSIDLEIFSTPFDKSSLDFLKQFNPCAYKIASFEITDYELIRHVAREQKPIIISTGIATIEEIQDVVEICRQEGNHDIVLLKCTSAYPAPLEQANMLTIPNLSQTFGVISGFSDHTLGITAPIVAVSLGAKVIEKHFTLNKSIDSPDKSFSLDQEEFRAMVQAIRDTEKLLGKVDYSLSKEKKNNRQLARGLHISRPIKIGEEFTADNLKALRPFNGVHPKYRPMLIGQKATKHYDMGDSPQEYILTEDQEKEKV